MSKVSFNVHGGLSKKLDKEIVGVLRRAVLDDIIREASDRLADALMAVVRLEGLDMADFVGEGLSVRIEISDVEEDEEEDAEE